MNFDELLSDYNNIPYINTTLVNCKTDIYDVYIGRPSKWGNPFTHLKNKKTLAKYICNNREEAINKYEEWLTKGDGKYLLNDLDELLNKKIGCWCKPKKCHGNILIKIINDKYGKRIV